MDKIISELEVLQSIYGEENIAVLKSNEESIEFTILVKEEGLYDIVFMISKSVNSPPIFIIRTVGFEGKRIDTLTNRLELEKIANAEVHRLGEECSIFPIIQLMIANLHSICMTEEIKQQTSLIESVQDIAFTRHVTLLALDHMRNTRSYLKELQTWCHELGISGYTFVNPIDKDSRSLPLSNTMTKDIILILQHIQPETYCNKERPIKEFLIRLRSQNVDVDSKGRPCKEKMSSVIGEFSQELKSRDENNINSGSEGLVVVIYDGRFRSVIKKLTSDSFDSSVIARIESILIACKTRW